MKDILKDKVAVVTGAGLLTGIGYATVVKLASMGATVVATDIEITPQLKRAIKTEFPKNSILALKVDVSKQKEIERCIDEVSCAYGGIDILINNAGTTVGSGDFLKIKPTDWLQSFSINSIGPGIFMQSVIPIMQARGGGVIVNNASTAGLGCEAGFGVYSAAKHALIALTKTVAAEFGVDNIRCNAVCPGYTSTDMHELVNTRLALEQNRDIADVRKDRYSAVSLKRAGTAAEIAETIAFLASPASSYVTGVAVAVSGGTAVGL